MKVLLALLSLVTLGHAQNTAYLALQDIVDARGESALQNVFVVRGDNGAPQPSSWTVFRGHNRSLGFEATRIREGGRISSAKVPAEEVGLVPHAQKVNFSVLNVDSNTAWNIAKGEARKENLRFQRIDYELRTSSKLGVPVWSMRLFNDEKSYMGELTISGATAAVVRPLRLSRFTIEVVDGRQEIVAVREPWARRAVRSVGRWFSQTGTVFGKDLLRAAGTTEEIVIGKRSRSFSEDAN